MKIYQLSLDYSFSLADVIETFDNADSLELCSEKPEMIKNFKYGWIMNESKIIPDFVLIMSSLLGCKYGFLKNIRKIIPSINFIPVKIDRDDYALFSNLPILENCVNIKKSKVSRFSNGDIMEISNPVFLPNDYPALFKVEEISSSYYCTEDFKNIITDNQYTGLMFNECNIKSKWWI